MDNDLIKKAYKDLKGDLNNSFDCNEGSDRYIYTLGASDYIGFPFEQDQFKGDYICTVEEFNNYKPEPKSKTIGAITKWSPTIVWFCFGFFVVGPFIWRQ